MAAMHLGLSFASAQLLPRPKLGRSVTGANQFRGNARSQRAQPRLHQQRCVRFQATTLEGSASAVRLSVQGRHLEVTGSLEEYVQSRLGPIVSKFEGGIKEVNVRLSASGGDRGKGAQRQRAEITVYTLRNGVVRAEDQEDSLYAAIDLVANKVKQQLRKMKEKAISRGKWAGSGGPKGGAIITDVVDWEDTSYAFPLDRKAQLPDDILRTKTLVLRPTTLEAAREEMDQVGHDFYIFRNTDEDNHIQVLYKRHHGGVGLISPVLLDN